MKRRLFLLLLALILGGCTPPVMAKVPTQVITPDRIPTQVSTATLPVAPADSQTFVTPTNLALEIDDSIPALLRQGLRLPATVHIAAPGEKASIRLEPLSDGSSSPAEAAWFYAVVAPFPTIPDAVSLDEVRAAWKGTPSSTFGEQPLLMSPSTQAVFEAAWGPASTEGVRVVAESDLVDAAWKKLPSWAIVPFEDLQPRWKVLRVGNYSLLDRHLDASAYPLVMRFGLVGPSKDLLAATAGDFQMPLTNRDPEKMTVLVMTGTTALVRGIAEKMEEKGVNYPAQDIGAWLRDADLTHISNEVPFYEKCPPPVRRDPRFCSDPKYLALLEEVGTNVVELTGNHELDWGQEPFLNTLAIYKQKSWAVYGGGKNQEDARQPVKLIDHGNKIAFIGCNTAGPREDWAGKDTPGAAFCDFEWMKTEVEQLRQEGYLVVATFQHVEVCSLDPHLTQKADFQKMVAAGAVIVSGSQAHCPQALSLQGDQFVHYGLGNLFFDQMDDAARREFIDRHVFYNGRYISTELLTAELEDSARPRPMNQKERQKLLEDAFRASGWIP